MSLHELDLAQKISDYVICVHGDKIEKCGPPEEILLRNIFVNYMESLPEATMNYLAAWKWNVPQEFPEYLL